MAIQFVVEDGTGKSDATSYISEADADQIVEDFGLAWASGVSSDDKEVALNAATQYIDNTYKPFQGVRTVTDQALMFPRVGLLDESGYGVDSDVIPTDLERATVEAAIYFNNNDKLFPNADETGKLKREKIKIDVLEFESEFLGSSSGSEISSKIGRLLSWLQESGGSGINVPVSRA